MTRTLSLDLFIAHKKFVYQFSRIVEELKAPFYRMMSALIKAIEMDKYDTKFIPEIVTLTFTTGQKVTYQVKNEQYSGLAVEKNKSIN